MPIAPEPLAELPPAQWSGRPTLADVLPWTARSLGETWGGGAGLPEVDARDVVVFLVDGLGDRLLERHAADAPTLTTLRATTLRAGFPSTTAASITSLAGGVPCGIHGIIGYSFRPDDASRVEGPPRLLNALRWTLDRSDGEPATAVYPPDRVAPLAGALGDLADAGVAVTYVMPGEFAGTGLTRSAFRAAGTHIPAAGKDEVRAGIAAALADRSAGRRFVYAYYPKLDGAGHLDGPGSASWRKMLRSVDALVADIASDLPAGAMLAVTGDHGMIAAGRRIDLDTEGELTAGVATIGGEPRVRHLYLADPASAADVVATWQARVGGDVRVATRAQTLDERWFGPEVAPAVVPRIGDVVAVAKDRTVLVRSVGEPFEATMIGHHGSWTADEQLVPLVLAQG
ncbi:alkaline phosphatase family protein [Gordonia sp. NB41Y]|uniref:alkaline phosphatase family protein n=1 Tax=Gordonia sp. NB41Y TaxID=875808 RepID=UPI00273B3F61|nr:alkaline phosphatase family protein [Gordonia sp. NB41Y]WLP92305.1 alkaline phosphatase family protein [Gordonia sp. NB41Y]